MTSEIQTRVTEGLGRVRQRIDAACRAAGRDRGSVRLIAVSKRHPEPAIRAAYALGQREFGENYVQELARKAQALADLPELRWHLIGHLQRNKIKDVIAAGASIDTLDSLRLGEALDARAREAGAVVPVLVQVNIGAEAQKAGVAEAELAPLCEALRKLPALQVQGLMAIVPLVDDPELSRPHFRHMRELAGHQGLREISMGMSDDLEVAIQEGATMVRVGTAIFGARPST